MTPKEYKQMMDYLTRSGIKKQVKFASDIARPDPKPRVQEIDAINAFMRRNPINKADGGRIGFYKGKLVEAGPNKGSYVVPISNERIYFSPEKYGSKAKAKKAMEQFIKDRPGTGSTYKGVGRIPLNKTEQKIFDKIKKYNIFPDTGDSQIKTKIRSGEYTKKIVDDYVKSFDLIKKENLINLTEMSKLLGVEEKTRIKGGPTAGFRAQIIDNLSREEERLSPSKRNFINEYLIKKMKLQKVKVGEGLPTYLIKKPTAQEIKDIQKYYLSRKGNLDKKLVERVKLFHNDPVFKKYTRKGLFLPQNEVMKKYLADRGMTYNQAAYAQIKLNHIYNGGSYNNWDLREIGKNKLAANTFFRATAKLPFKNPYRAQQYVDAMKTVTDDLGPEYFGKKGTMQDFKNKARAILKDKGIPIYSATDKKPFGIQLNELTGITAASRTQTGAMAQFFNLVPGQFNLGAYAAFNRTFEEAQINLENEIKKGAKGNPQKVLKDFNAKRNTLLKNYDFLKQGDVPTLSLQSPKEFYGEKFMKRMSDQGLDLEKNFKEKGYTIGVSKNVPTIKEFIEDEKVQERVIKNFRKNEKILLDNLVANSKLDKCIINRKADGGRIGFALSDECIRDGLNETKKKAAAGDKKAARQLVKTAEAASKGSRLLKNVLGPGAILGEAVFEGALIGNKVLGGKPADIAYAESYLSYLDPRKYRGELDPLKMEREDMLESTADKNILRSGFAAQDQLSAFNKAIEDRNLAKARGRMDQYIPAAAEAREQGARADQSADIISSEAFKDASRVAQEYLQGQAGKQQARFGVFSVPQSAQADERRRLEAMKNMSEQMPRDFLTMKTSDLLDQTQYLRSLGYDVSTKDLMAQQDMLKSIPLSKAAEIYSPEQVYGTQGKFAGGGIAKLAGDRSGAMLESMNPDKDGLPGLLKRVKKV